MHFNCWSAFAKHLKRWRYREDRNPRVTGMESRKAGGGKLRVRRSQVAKPGLRPAHGCSPTLITRIKLFLSKKHLTTIVKLCHNNVEINKGIFCTVLPKF